MPGVSGARFVLKIGFYNTAGYLPPLADESMAANASIPLCALAVSSVNMASVANAGLHHARCLDHSCTVSNVCMGHAACM